MADRGLLELLLKNALRNAVEATSEAGEPFTPVTVTWGETDIDYWISVLDRGIGLPQRLESAFKIGASLKKGHLGVGLALAAQAADSMQGQISLTPRDGGGAQFEFRWPRYSGAVQ